MQKCQSTGLLFVVSLFFGCGLDPAKIRASLVEAIPALSSVLEKEAGTSQSESKASLQMTFDTQQQFRDNLTNSVKNIWTKGAPLDNDDERKLAMSIAEGRVDHHMRNLREDSDIYDLALVRNLNVMTEFAGRVTSDQTKSTWSEVAYRINGILATPNLAAIPSIKKEAISEMTKVIDPYFFDAMAAIDTASSQLDRAEQTLSPGQREKMQLQRKIIDRWKQWKSKTSADRNGKRIFSKSYINPDYQPELYQVFCAIDRCGDDPPRVGSEILRVLGVPEILVNPLGPPYPVAAYMKRMMGKAGYLYSDEATEPTAKDAKLVHEFILAAVGKAEIEIFLERNLPNALASSKTSSAKAIEVLGKGLVSGADSELAVKVAASYVQNIDPFAFATSLEVSAGLNLPKFAAAENTHLANLHFEKEYLPLKELASVPYLNTISSARMHGEKAQEYSADVARSLTEYLRVLSDAGGYELWLKPFLPGFQRLGLYDDIPKHFLVGAMEKSRQLQSKLIHVSHVNSQALAKTWRSKAWVKTYETVVHAAKVNDKDPSVEVEIQKQVDSAVQLIKDQLARGVSFDATAAYDKTELKQQVYRKILGNIADSVQIKSLAKVFAERQVAALSFQKVFEANKALGERIRQMEEDVNFVLNPAPENATPSEFVDLFQQFLESKNQCNPTVASSWDLEWERAFEFYSGKGVTHRRAYINAFTWVLSKAGAAPSKESGGKVKDACLGINRGSFGTGYRAFKYTPKTKGVANPRPQSAVDAQLAKAIRKLYPGPLDSELPGFTAQAMWTGLELPECKVGFGYDTKDAPPGLSMEMRCFADAFVLNFDQALVDELADPTLTKVFHGALESGAYDSKIDTRLVEILAADLVGAISWSLLVDAINLLAKEFQAKYLIDETTALGIGTTKGVPPW